MSLELQESPASSKTKKIFYFLGNYKRSMIKGKFEKKNAVTWLTNHPPSVHWTVTAESWKKLEGTQLENQISKMDKIENPSQSKNRKSRIENRTKILSQPSHYFTRGLKD